MATRTASEALGNGFGGDSDSEDNTESDLEFESDEEDDFFLNSTLDEFEEDEPTQAAIPQQSKGVGPTSTPLPAKPPTSTAVLPSPRLLPVVLIRPLSMCSKETLISHPAPSSSTNYISHPASEISSSTNCISHPAPEISSSTNYISHPATEISSSSTNYISHPAPEISSSSTNYISHPAPEISSSSTNYISQPATEISGSSTNYISQPAPETPASSTHIITHPALETPAASTNYNSQHAPEIPASSTNYISPHAPEIPASSTNYNSQHAPEIPASSTNYISQPAPEIPAFSTDISQSAPETSTAPSPPRPAPATRWSRALAWSSDESRSPSPTTSMAPSPPRPTPSTKRSSRRLMWSSDESRPPSPEYSTPPSPPRPAPSKRKSRILVYSSDSSPSPMHKRRKEGKRSRRKSHGEKKNRRTSHREKKKRRTSHGEKKNGRTSHGDKRHRRSGAKSSRRTSHGEKKNQRTSHREKKKIRRDKRTKPESSQKGSNPEGKQVRRSKPGGGGGAGREEDGGSEAERWCDAHEADVPPAQPLFKPVNTPGPRIDTLQSWTPLSLFKLFFSASVIRTILANTNRSGSRRRWHGNRKEWKTLGFSEFYAFLSIIIFTGLLRPHVRGDLWRRAWPYNLRFPRDIMSKMRFDSIFSSLKMSNPDEDAENDKKKGTPAYDKLFKIKPLYNDILTACQSLFQPAREIAIDERMVASKARIGIKQYMKNKPTRWGYKLFVLADSRCGYTWNFFVYQGKNPEKPASVHGVGYSSVMDLLDVSLLGTGYRLYIDNFYTSPALLQELLLKNTTACGTMRTNQRDFPKSTRNDLTPRSVKGDMRWIRRGSLLFVKWVDTKHVKMCSTMHQAYSGETVRRKVKEADGEWHYREVAIPDAAKDYNKYMGGVDLSDALIGCYNVLGKTMKWYKTFFYHFVDIAIVNSFILHKHIAASKGNKHLSQKFFRETLMKELADEARALAGEGEPPPPPPKVTCMPSFLTMETRKVCRNCRAEGSKVKTVTYCRNCNVPLCCNTKRNCFTAWHDRPPLRKAS